MRRIVARRIDLAGVDQRRQARLGTRSDRASASLPQPRAALRSGFLSPRRRTRRRFPYDSRRPSLRLSPFRRVLPHFPLIHSALPTGRAAHRSGKQRAASIRPFSRPPTWNSSEAHPAGRATPIPARPTAQVEPRRHDGRGVAELRGHGLPAGRGRTLAQ